MKKILLLLRCFPQLGGIESMTLNLADELARRGYEVSIYAGGAPNPQCTPSDYSTRYPDIRFELVEGMPDGDRLREYVRREGMEIVIVQGFDPRLTPAVRGIAEENEVRIISVLHTNPRMTRKKHKAENEGSLLLRIVKWLGWGFYERRVYAKYLKNLRELARLSESVVVLSEGYKSPFLQLIPGYSREKVHVIPNFIPEKGYEKNDTADGNQEDGCAEKGNDREKLIVYVGRVVEHTKRVSRIINIWRRLAPLFPDWRMEIVGDGPQKGMYEGVVRRKGIERIRFVGQCQDVGSLLERASLIVQTSDNEGMPMCIIEAMRRGCVPIVYNSYASASELIDDNNDGLLITPFVEEEFIGRMSALMQSKKEIARLSSRAIESSQRFTPDAVLPLWETLFRNRKPKANP